MKYDTQGHRKLAMVIHPHEFNERTLKLMNPSIVYTDVQEKFTHQWHLLCLHNVYIRTSFSINSHMDLPDILINQSSLDYLSNDNKQHEPFNSRDSDTPKKKRRILIKKIDLKYYLLCDLCCY